MSFRPASAASGFTLIEVLVVLVIIGVIVALGVTNFGDTDQSRLQREAERLSLLLETARDEAIAGGVTLGWGVQEQGYRFFKRTEQGQWTVLDDNETLRARELPQGMRIAEVKVNLAVIGNEDKLAFSPSGVNAPFSLKLIQGQSMRRLTADAMGRIDDKAEALNAATQP